MNKSAWRGIFIPLFLVLILLLPYEAGTLSQHNRCDSVRINILSKHLRLMKENGRSELNFTFPSGSIFWCDDKEFYAVSLNIRASEGNYNISADNRSLNFSKCIIYSDAHNTLCNVKIDNEYRSYPLPLEISREKDSLKFYVTENTEEYAMDSARAETGYIKPENSEALYAVALAIHGRCRIDSLKHKHTDCDFCDLTCCQTYRGRRGENPISAPFIDTAAITCGLFFHSSSGGRLFSESVFSSGGRRTKPPADILYSENLVLSRNIHQSWEALLDKNEASLIIYPDQKMQINNITYDPGKEIVLLDTDKGEKIFSPENFRLKINRKKGWNFIKSNNYTVSCYNGCYKFSGSGLGHCTGISIDGAVQLASKGYSRYEILEHYYPDIKYSASGDNRRSFQYTVYDSTSGKILYSSTGPAFLERRVPCGSIFKLFTVIYLADERRDLFFNHKYICKAHNSAPLPQNCWDRKGHGEMNTGSAIYNSCNIYFASLHDKIDREDFQRWFEKFTKENGISMHLPVIGSTREWCNLLAGLDFRIDISVKDMVKLSMYIHNAGSSRLPADTAEVISESLRRTFISGTAKITEEDLKTHPELKILPPDMWGKTGTVISGTNSHFSYGIFTGGTGDRGIITLVRKGKGTDAAHLSVPLLKNI